MQIRIAVAAGLVFLAGFVSGVVVGKYVLRSPTQAPGSFRPGPPDPAMMWRRGIVERMSEDLQLTEQQAREIDQIIEESQQRMRKLWESIEPQARQIFEQTQSRIEQVLTPEQREKYREKLQERMKRRPPRRRPGPPGPPDHEMNRPPPPEEPSSRFHPKEEEGRSGVTNAPAPGTTMEGVVSNRVVPDSVPR